MRWTGHVVCMGEIANAYKIFVSEPEGRRPLGRPRYRQEYIILEWILAK
jgi:hypothetical protein